MKEDAACRFAGEFRYLDTNGADLSAITKEIRMNEEINAPVEKGAAAGKAVYMLNGKEIGAVDIIFEEAVDKAGYLDYLKKAWDKFQCFST